MSHGSGRIRLRHLLLASAAFCVPAGSLADTRVVVDGGAGRGFHVGPASGAPGVTVDGQVFTNFLTRGGDGSGGGAGMGGVFFIDQGGQLILNNVDFNTNAVRGGDGGGGPSLSLGTLGVPLTDLQVNVQPLQEQGAVPLLDQAGAFDTIAIGNTQGLAGGMTVVVPNAGTALIQSVNPDGTITLDRTLTAAGPIVRSVRLAADPNTLFVTDVTGIQANATLLAAERVGRSITQVTAANVLELADASGLTPGMRLASDPSRTIVAIAGNTVTLSSTHGIVAPGTVNFDRDITLVVRDLRTGGSGTEGFITYAAPPGGAAPIGTLLLPGIGDPPAAITLFNATGLTANAVAGAAGTTLNLAVDPVATGLRVGMLLDGAGFAPGTTITAINGQALTLSQAVTGPVSGFDARLAPINGATLTLPVPDPRLAVGMRLVGEGVPANTVISAINGNVLTLSNAVPASASGLAFSNVVSAAPGQLRLLGVDPAAVRNGFTVTIPGGGSFTVTAVTSLGGGEVLLTVPGFVPPATLERITIASPLTAGGSMNDIANIPYPGMAGATAGTGGRAGNNASWIGTVLASGEGQPGGIGAPGAMGSGTGGTGGAGGSGSSGLPVNVNLMAAVYAAKSQVALQAGLLGASLVPIGFPPVPNIPLSVGFKATLADAKVDLGLAIAQLVAWNVSLGLGQVASGGHGGEGGRGGNGATFFGGGAGGAGGDGGDAGNRGSGTAGNGGHGGAGGTGGFGAGGGQGGAGGEGGAGAFFRDGTPGAGGLAGFGGGVGANGARLGGGGGAGMGGAIFVREGGALLITGDSFFGDNNAAGGSGGAGGQAGAGVGSDIFMMRGSSVTIAPGIGKMAIFMGSIADDSRASFEGAPFASGDGAGLTIGAGLTLFNGVNTYTGATTITGGALAALDGVGIHPNSNITFAGAGRRTGPTALDELGAGVLLSSGAFNRQVGPQSNRVQWTGSGGFAATGAELVVNLGGMLAPQALTWGAGGFVPHDASLVFGSAQANAPVRLRNAINLGGAERSIVVRHGATAEAIAILDGALSNGALRVGAPGYNGFLHLRGANSFTGGTIVDFGTVSTQEWVNANGVLVPGGTLANSGAVTVNQGGRFLFGTSDTIGTLTVNGRVDGRTGVPVLALVRDVEILRALDMAGLSNQGGVVAIGFDSISRGAVVNSADGLMILGAGLDAAGQVFTQDGHLVVLGQRRLSVAGLGGNGLITLASANPDHLILNQTGVSTFSGRLEGAGHLTLTGGGVLVLDGASSFTGVTTVQQGELITAGPGPVFGGGGAVLVGAQGSLTIGTSEAIGTLGNAGTVTVQAGDALQVAGLVNGGTVHLNGTLTSTGAVWNEAAGVINLNADLTAAGQTVTQDGLLSVTGDRRLLAGQFLGAGTVRLNAGSRLTLDQGGNSVFAGIIEGSGALRRRGAGELVLTGQNSFTGPTTLEAGLLRTAGEAGRLAGGGVFTVQQGAGLTLGTSEAIGLLTNSGEVRLDAGRHLHVAGLVNTGTGMMLLDGALTSLGALHNQPGGAITLNADLTATGQALTQDGSLTIGGVRRATLGQFAGAGVVTLTPGAELILEQGGASTFAGSFQGAGALTRAGGGRLTLTGTNSFTGLATVQPGAELALAGTGSIATASALALGGVFDIAARPGGASLRALTGDGQVLLGAHPLRLTAAQGGFGGQISGAGGLFLDAGSTVFTGANGFTGPTSIAAGASLGLAGAGGIAGSSQVLVDGSFTVQGSSPGASLQALSVRAGGTARAEAPVQVAGTLAVTGGTLEGPARFTAPRYALDNAAVNAPLGAGEMEVRGNSFLTAPAAAGTVRVLEQATLGLMGAQLLSEQAGVEVRQTGTLALLGGDQVIRDLTGAGSIVLNGFELRVTGNSVFTGEFEGEGDVFVAAGQLQIGSDTKQTQLTVGQDGKLDVTGSVTSSTMTMVQGDLTIGGGGQVSTSGFTLAAGGTTQVGGNLQSDTTLVEGRMMLTGGRVSNSQMRVAGPGGMLGGSGFVSGDTLVTGGGSLAAGFSVGALNFDNLALGAGGRLELEIEGAAGPGVVDGHDVYRASGAIAIDPGAVLDIRRFSGPSTSQPGFEPARGQGFRFLEAEPGRISGFFGTATSDFRQGLIVNLATGEAIGTGRPAGEALEATLGRTANERRMVRELRVAGTAGNVQQFQGGRLVGDALKADALSPLAASMVFQRGSPEAYAGLHDQARRAARQGLETAFRGGQQHQVGNVTFFAGGELARSGRSRSRDGAGYTINTASMQFGAEARQDRLGIGIFGGRDQGGVNTGLMRGSMEGWSFGGRLSYLLDPGRDLTVALDGVLAGQDQHGRRQTQTDTSRFRTRSSAGMVRLSAGFTAWQGGRWNVRPEFGLGYGTASTRGFTERNPTALQALSVGRQSSAGVMLDAGIGAAYRATENLTFSGGLRVVADLAGSRRTVNAGFAGDPGRFSVEAPGLGAVTGEARLGVEFRPAASVSLRLDAGAGVSDRGVVSGDLAARVALRF